MPSQENYTEAHIADLRAQTGADPSLLERTVFTSGLLEAIRNVDPVAYAYLIKSLQLLQPAGHFTESVL